MCGIIGIASTGLLVENDKKFFRNALFCDQLRGVDSTGIFAVGKQDVPDIKIFKRAIPACDFLDMRKTEKMIGALGTTRVMVGHNRAATKGSVNNSNAHPFQYGDITMVHNGTLNNYSKLPGYTYNENDSKLLCRGIAELGIQGAIDCIDGAWSLVWHDASDNTLNFLRNGQRPMALASNNNRKDLYFASELMMLDWLTARHSIKVDEILNTEVNQHIKLDLDANVFHPVIKEVVKKTTFFVNNQGGGQSKKPVSKPADKLAKPPTKARDTLLASKLREKEADGKTKVPRVGQFSKAYFYAHTPYKSNDSSGVMLGTMSESPWLTVEIHNQKTENFVEGYYKFQVCGVRIEGGLATGDLELLGHSPKIVGGKANKPLNKPSAPKEVTVIKKQLTPFEMAEKKFREKQVKQGSRPAILTLIPSSTKTPPLVSDSTDWKANQKKLQASKLLDKELGDKLLKKLTLDHDGLNVVSDVDPDFPYAGANGCSLSQSVYDQLTRHGCCQCSGNISDDDAPDLLWVDTVSPVCLSCQAESEYGGSNKLEVMKKEMKDDGCPDLPKGHELH